MTVRFLLKIADSEGHPSKTCMLCSCQSEVRSQLKSPYLGVLTLSTIEPSHRSLAPPVSGFIMALSLALHLLTEDLIRSQLSQALA
jgi:hypothetical protein